MGFESIIACKSSQAILVGEKKVESVFGFKEHKCPQKVFLVP